MVVFADTRADIISCCVLTVACSADMFTCIAWTVSCSDKTNATMSTSFSMIDAAGSVAIRKLPATSDVNDGGGVASATRSMVSKEMTSIRSSMLSEIDVRKREAHN